MRGATKNPHVKVAHVATSWYCRQTWEIELMPHQRLECRHLFLLVRLEQHPALDASKLARYR